MRRGWLLSIVTCLALAACGGAAAPPPAPSGPTPSASVPPSSEPSPPSSASPSAVTTIALRQAPAGLGCDTMAVQYTSATFDIDAAAVDPVTATTNEGVSLRTFWSAGFVGGSADEQVVRDPDGQIVAADGDVLDIPQGAFPRLKGYFVCPSQDALYVLLQDPA